MTNPPEWTTSSCSGEQGQCVEVQLAPVVGVRDTKNRADGALEVSAMAWRAFIGAVRR
ncbi:MAG: hypothetical protein QOI21_3606 [Actinomycetota bacterium]|nr:hypothetical protein [Actinomycetota bacterium]